MEARYTYTYTYTHGQRQSTFLQLRTNSIYREHILVYLETLRLSWVVYTRECVLYVLECVLRSAVF